MICIDLTNPIVIGVSIAVISAAILGIIHYGRTLAQLNFTDKKLSNVLTELDTLNKNYKAEITNIEKRYNNQLGEMLKLTKEAIGFYEAKIEKLIHDNRPKGLLAGYADYIGRKNP
jgi:hypothetical protein